MRVIAFVAFAAMCCGTVLASLVPARHGDFAHYTFALTWQPGICSTDGGCLRDQPRLPLIGLHGLWASRPRQLIRSGVTDPQWWSRGCDFYVHSTAAPRLDAYLHWALGNVMPHFAHGLLTHEYDKHVQCFGFDPAAFFSTELAMRHAVVEGGFGRFLVSQTGRTVTHAAVAYRFRLAFSTDETRSLQLQCGRNRAGQTVLTQFWITIRTSELAAFPRAVSLMNSPVNEDTCPATFRVPSWQ
ncbi:MAG: ribonuclease T2 family protein [Candidatus Tyrphobacter sp.]